MTTGLLATALVCSSTSAQEGGISLFSAPTLYASGTRVSIGYVAREEGGLYQGSSEITDPLARSLSERRLVLGLDYGLRRDLTLSLLVPHVTKELSSSLGEQRSTGPGDVALLAKQRLYKRDWQGGAANLSLIAGLELPTGSTDERDGGLLLEPSLQPGSGSWDPVIALAGNLSDGRWRLDATALYKENREGDQDFAASDLLTIGVRGRYRVLHAPYPGPSLGLDLGLHWRLEGSAEQEGVSLEDSGASELLLRPGIEFHPWPNWDISLSLDLPLALDYEGEQLGFERRLVLALGIRI